MTGGEENRHRPTGKTNLMVACEQGRTLEVKIILQKKPLAVASRDRNGKTALHYCAESGSLPCAQLVVAADQSLLHVHDSDGYTPLHLAVIAGNRAVARLLLKYGADPDRVDKERHSTVHWASVCGDIESLELLLNHGANPSTPDILGAFPIHYAAQMCGAHSLNGKDPETGINTLKKLVQRGASVQCRDRDGREPLLWAASTGSNEAVLILFTAGANIETTDKDGLTALHCASSRGHTSCVETLVTLCGARVNAGDAIGCSPLFYAAAQGHADSVQILLKYSADPNLQDNKGRTPAHCAASKGQLEIMRILDSNGADLWIRNSRGNLPLHEAVQSGRKDLVQWLLQQCPRAVNATNINGRTPLHIASLKNNVEMCEVLIDYGAHINPLMVNTKGFLMSPLDVSVYQGNQRCAKYLQLHGAVPATKVLENNEINRNLLFSLGNFAYNQKERSDDEPISAASFDHRVLIQQEVPRDTQTRTIRAGQPQPLPQPEVPDESLLTNVTSGEVTDASVHIHLTRDDLWSLWESLMQELTSEMSGSEVSSEGQRKKRPSTEVRQLKPILTNVYLRRTSSKEIAGESILDKSERREVVVSVTEDDEGKSKKEDSSMRQRRSDLRTLPKVIEAESVTNHDWYDHYSQASDIDIDEDDIQNRKQDNFSGKDVSDSVGSDTEVTRTALAGVKVTRLRKRRSDARSWGKEPEESETSSGHRPEQREANPYLKRYFQKQARAAEMRHYVSGVTAEDTSTRRDRNAHQGDGYKHVVREDYDAYHKKQRRKGSEANRDFEGINIKERDRHHEKENHRKKHRRRSLRDDWESVELSGDNDNQINGDEIFEDQQKSDRRHSPSEKHRSKSKHRRKSHSQEPHANRQWGSCDKHSRDDIQDYSATREEMLDNDGFDEDQNRKKISHLRRKSSGQFLEVPLQTTSNLASSEREETIEETEESKLYHQHYHHHHHHHHHHHRPLLEKEMSVHNEPHHFAEHRKHRRHYHRKRSRLRSRKDSMYYSLEQRPLSDDDSRFYRSRHSSLEEHRSKSENSGLQRKDSGIIPVITIFDEESKPILRQTEIDENNEDSNCDNFPNEIIEVSAEESKEPPQMTEKMQVDLLKHTMASEEIKGTSTAIDDKKKKKSKLVKQNAQTLDAKNLSKRRASRTNILSPKRKEKSAIVKEGTRSISRTRKKVSPQRDTKKVTKISLKSTTQLSTEKEVNKDNIKSSELEVNGILPDIRIVSADGSSTDLLIKRDDNTCEDVLNDEKTHPKERVKNGHISPLDDTQNNYEDKQSKATESLGEDENTHIKFGGDILEQSEETKDEINVSNHSTAEEDKCAQPPHAKEKMRTTTDEDYLGDASISAEEINKHDIEESQNIIENANSDNIIPDENTTRTVQISQPEVSERNQEQPEVFDFRGNQQSDYNAQIGDENELGANNQVGSNKINSHEKENLTQKDEEAEQHTLETSITSLKTGDNKLHDSGEKERYREELGVDDLSYEGELPDDKKQSSKNFQDETNLNAYIEDVNAYFGEQPNEKLYSPLSTPEQKDHDSELSGNEEINNNMLSDDQSKASPNKELNLNEINNLEHRCEATSDKNIDKLKADIEEYNNNEMLVKMKDESKVHFSEQESSSEAETKFHSDDSDEIQPKPDITELIMLEENGKGLMFADDQKVDNNKSEYEQDLHNRMEERKKFPIETEITQEPEKSRENNSISSIEEEELQNVPFIPIHSPNQDSPIPHETSKKFGDIVAHSGDEIKEHDQKHISKEIEETHAYESKTNYLKTTTIEEKNQKENSSQTQEDVRWKSNEKYVTSNHKINTESGENPNEHEINRSISVQTSYVMSPIMMIGETENQSSIQNIPRSTIAIQTENSNESSTITEKQMKQKEKKQTLEIGTCTEDYTFLKQNRRKTQNGQPEKSSKPREENGTRGTEIFKTDATIQKRDIKEFYKDQKFVLRSPERHNPSALFYKANHVSANFSGNKTKKDLEKQNRGALFYTTPSIVAQDNTQKNTKPSTCSNLLDNSQRYQKRQPGNARYKSSLRDRSLESERAVAIANSAFRKLNSNGQLTVFDSSILNTSSDNPSHMPLSQFDNSAKPSCQRRGEYSSLEKPGFLWVHFGSGSSPIHTLKRKPNFTSQRAKREETTRTDMTEEKSEKKQAEKQTPSSFAQRQNRLRQSRSVDRSAKLKESKPKKDKLIDQKTDSVSEKTAALQVKSKTLTSKSVSSIKERVKVNSSKKSVIQNKSENLNVNSPKQIKKKQTLMKNVQEKSTASKQRAQESGKQKLSPEKKQTSEEKGDFKNQRPIDNKKLEMDNQMLQLPEMEHDKDMNAVTMRSQDKSVKHQTKGASKANRNNKESTAKSTVNNEDNSRNIQQSDHERQEETNEDQDDERNDENQPQIPRLTETAKSSSLDEGDVRLVIERKEDPGISIKIRMKDRKKKNERRDYMTDVSSAPGESDQSYVKDSGYISTTESIHNHRRSITIDLGHTTASINAGMKGVRSQSEEQNISLPSVQNDVNVHQPETDERKQQKTLPSKLPILEPYRQRSNSTIFMDYNRTPRKDSITTSELSVASEGEGAYNMSSNIQSVRGKSGLKNALQVPENIDGLSKDFQRQTAQHPGRSKVSPRRSSIPIYRAHSDGNLHRPASRFSTNKNKSLSTPSIHEEMMTPTPRSKRRMFSIKETSPSELRHSDTEIECKSAEKLKLPSILLYEPDDENLINANEIQKKFPRIPTPNKGNILYKSKESISSRSNSRATSIHSLKLPLLQQPIKCRCNIQPYKYWDGRRTRSAVDCMANVHFLTEEELESFDAKFFGLSGRLSSCSGHIKKKSASHRTGYRALKTQTLKRLQSGSKSASKLPQAVTFHVDHQKERNTFQLPTDKLRHNKKWQVVFTIGKTKNDKLKKDIDSKK